MVGMLCKHYEWSVKQYGGPVGLICKQYEWFVQCYGLHVNHTNDV